MNFIELSNALQIPPVENARTGFKVQRRAKKIARIHVKIASARARQPPTPLFANALPAWAVIWGAGYRMT
ncbi:MAG: hypothetical protein ABSF11_09955 [Methylocella sp.]|jgi:hypothetical protein